MKNLKIEVVNLKTAKAFTDYVGREHRSAKYGYLPGSALANPFHEGRDGDRDTVIWKYGIWIVKKIHKMTPQRREFVRLLEKAMHGEQIILACWCAPMNCHADVIADLIRRYLRRGKKLSYAEGVSNDYRQQIKQAAEKVQDGSYDNLLHRWASEYRQYVDSKIVGEEIVDSFYYDKAGRKCSCKELKFISSLQPVNHDIPEDRQLLDMGCDGNENPIQKYRQIDRADFTERCVVMNRKVYGLYERRKPDIIVKSHLRQETMEGQINKWRAEQKYPLVTDDEALDIDTIVNAYRTLKVDRRCAMRLMHGYMKTSKEAAAEGEETPYMTSGIREADDAELQALAARFEQLSDAMAEFDYQPEENKPRSIDDERIYWFEVTSKQIENGWLEADPYQQMLMIEQRARRDLQFPDEQVDPDVVIYKSEADLIDEYGPQSVDWDEEHAEIDEYLDDVLKLIDDNTYSAQPFHDETSGLSESYIVKIKTADWKVLSAEKKSLMEGDYWFMTQQQKSQAWDFIHDREEKLIKAQIDNGRPIARLVKAYIMTSKDERTASALLFAWQDGRVFDTDETVFEFDAAPGEEQELAAAWTVLKRRFKKERQERYRKQAAAQLNAVALMAQQMQTAQLS